MNKMELFVVKNKSNEVLGSFGNKKSAKEIRNKLQTETDAGLPEVKDRMNHRAWNFRVSLGSDHRLSPVGKH